MSGKRHHYIPQLLLRGFLSKKKKKEMYSYVYEKGKASYEANIKNIAVETYFYKHADNDADESITKKEGMFATEINRIRSTGSLDGVSLEVLVSFVESLAVRTKNMRSLLEDSTGYLIESASKAILADSNLDDAINVALSDEDKLIDECVAEIVAAAPHLDKLFVRRLVVKKFQENRPQLEQFMYGAAKAFGPQMFTNLSKNIPTEVAKAQVRCLNNESLHGGRSENYLKLCWTLEIFDEGALILGDVGPLGIDSKGGVVPLLFEGDLSTIFLPIRSNILLVGSKESEAMKLTADEVNLLTASMSINFFVSAKDTQDINRLKNLIGVKSSVYYKDVIDTNIRKEFGDMGCVVLH